MKAVSTGISLGFFGLIMMAFAGGAMLFESCRKDECILKCTAGCTGEGQVSCIKACGEVCRR